MVTMKEAKERIRRWVEARLEEGCTCPCCGQTCKLYPRKLNSNMAQFLVSLVLKYQRTQEPVHYSKCRYRGRDYAYLEHFGLARTFTSSDPKQRTSGLWEPTEDGVAFVFGEISIPRVAYVYNNEVRAWSEEQVSIGDVMDKRASFDYEELMSYVRG